jgi:hypothetical protein
MALVSRKSMGPFHNKCCGHHFNYEQYESILANIPNINANPLIVSNRPIGKASSGGRPKEPKSPCVPWILLNFGKPCIINAMPAIILIGNGPKEDILSKLIQLLVFNSFKGNSVTNNINILFIFYG